MGNRTIDEANQVIRSVNTIYGLTASLEDKQNYIREILNTPARQKLGLIAHQVQGCGNCGCPCILTPMVIERAKFGLTPPCPLCRAGDWPIVEDDKAYTKAVINRMFYPQEETIQWATHTGNKPRSWFPETSSALREGRIFAVPFIPATIAWDVMNWAFGIDDDEGGYY
jgi:hypothetical protein